MNADASGPDYPTLQVLPKDSLCHPLDPLIVLNYVQKLLYTGRTVQLIVAFTSYPFGDVILPVILFREESHVQRNDLHVKVCRAHMCSIHDVVQDVQKDLSEPHDEGTGIQMFWSCLQRNNLSIVFLV